MPDQPQPPTLIHLDAAPVSEADAYTLMLRSLLDACMYFEATALDSSARLLRSLDGDAAPGTKAIRAFMVAIERAYQELDQ